MLSLADAPQPGKRNLGISLYRPRPTPHSALKQPHIAPNRRGREKAIPTTGHDNAFFGRPNLRFSAQAMTTASSPLQPSAGCVYCNYCPGYCCYRLKGSTLFITAEDINRLARHFGISDGEVRKRYLEGKNTFKTRDDGSCLFLSNARMIKRCSVHTARPRQCRDFPYDAPCPYLLRADLLEQIQPRIELALARPGKSE